MKSKIISSSLLIVGFLIGASALSALAAWTAPTVPNAGETTPCDPPKCNTAAPLNVASGLQTKLGQLSLNSSGAGAYGLEVVNAIKLIDADMLLPAPNTKNPNNMVLTSGPDGVGTWKPIPGVTKPVVVNCSKTVVRSYQALAGTAQYVAGDCGGVLPDSTYYGSLKGASMTVKTSANGLALDYGAPATILNANEGGPGFSVEGTCNGNVSCTYTVSGTYTKF